MITPRMKNPETPDVTETPITAAALRPLLVAVDVDDAGWSLVVLGEFCTLCVTVKGVSELASVDDVELEIVSELDVSVVVIVVIDVVNNVDGDVVVVVSVVW